VLALLIAAAFGYIGYRLDVWAAPDWGAHWFRGAEMAVLGFLLARYGPAPKPRR
jgi:hypothetical protein